MNARTIRTLAKWGVVIAGYAAAGLIATAAVNARYLHQSAQAQASPGMCAWGDFVLFLEVFGLGAILPTALALYFLRPIRLFWILSSIAALAFAATGLGAALIVALMAQLDHERTQSFVRILAAHRDPAGNDVTCGGCYLRARHIHGPHSTHPARVVGGSRDRGIPRPVLLLPLVRPDSRSLTTLPMREAGSVGCPNAVGTGCVFGAFLEAPISLG